MFGSRVLQNQNRAYRGEFVDRAPRSSQLLLSLLDRPSTLAVCSQGKIFEWNAPWPWKMGRHPTTVKIGGYRYTTLSTRSSRIKACRGQNTESHHCNPAVTYSQRNQQHREMDDADPDDWWGIHLNSHRNSVSSSRPKSSKEQAQQTWDFQRQAEFQKQDQQEGSSMNDGKNRTYYYHEYHYMSYYFEKHGYKSHKSNRTRHGYAYSSDVMKRDPGTALELAHYAFQAALATARREVGPIDAGVESKSMLRDLEKSIAKQVQEAAGHCGSDVIAFARVVGVLPLTQEQRGGQEAAFENPHCNESLRKKARKKIIVTFHPDKLLHLHRSGKHLGYFLGHAVLQAVSSMPK